VTATVARLLAAAEDRLRATSDTARLDAEIMLAHVLGVGRGNLLARADRVTTGAQAQAFEQLVSRRVAREPVAYLTGQRGFWSLDLLVDPRVLVPRPDTELLVELALDRVPAGGPPRVLDLGTGSGAIALAIASERPEACVVATDDSADALIAARANAVVLELDQVGFREGAWLDAVAGEAPFDVIVSNPPYLAESDPHLVGSELAFEPRDALVAGPTGLEALQVIACGAPAHLAPGGWLLLEHGFEQGATVRKLLAAAGLEGVETVRDLAGRERVTLGRAAPRATG
jgi:release factor glutamine methyltransferase